jgi:2,4'-dihydroxyacetophenone dioxygenase
VTQTLPPTNAPGPVSSLSGVPLPLVALPQAELLSVNQNEIPVLVDAFGPGIHFQPLRLDLERNEWVAIARFDPGTSMPMHYHTGPVEIWTLSGLWQYVEYPNEPQTGGSYLYEPGGSVHTLMVPDDCTEPAVQIVRAVGALVNFNEDGTFHSVLDALTVRHVTDTVSAERGLKTPFIDGGFASTIVSS